MSSFFEVLNGEYTAKLRIPPLFVSRFSSLMPKTVKLISSLEGSWMVDIEEEDNKNLYFKRGWNTFVEDNALETGQFIVFKFDGDSTFKATIFGNSACEKKLENQPCINSNYCITRHHNKRARTLEESDPTKVEETEESDPTKVEETEESDPTEVEETEASQNEVEEKNYESDSPVKKTGNSYGSCESPDSDCEKNPSFKIIMKPAYAQKGVMNLPTEFFLKHMKNKRQEVEIETGEGEWTVTLLTQKKRTRTFARLSKGWSDFAKANHLKPGETLVFQMIRKGDRPRFIVHRQRG
ncbi:hypothetical protein QN277_024823 [Acacia crassicarpa]|uniref:TF-B3 domain-containing protein n=1 Tax=Acacia crassicarpa TaxID=499986 RepID=A0AAE1JHJ4_9FABA|nr:hypothetical protein QN277_024823 [Acacia crassicarpa]